MATTRQAGPGMGLNTWGLAGLNSQRSLAAGEAHIIPAGQYYLTAGPYSMIETLDPISGLWRTQGVFGNGGQFISADGVNVRIVNRTGTAVGAFVTNVGSGYTSAPTVTASAGGSTWQAIVGGAVSQTVTITSGGAGFNYPPQLVIAAPPVGGVQATATCTLSAGAINAITVTNQGAGYTAAPAITVIPDPREATAATPGPTTNPVLATALTGAGTISAVLCTNMGTALTSVPTLTFSGGGGSSAAATVVMCFSATGFTVGSGGAGYGNAQPFAIITAGGLTAGGAGAIINPSISNGAFIPRQANFSGVSSAGGAITATGAVANDSGLFQAVPLGLVIAGGSGLATGVGQVTMTVGGVTDYYSLQTF